MNDPIGSIDCYGIATVGEEGEIVLPTDVLLQHGLEPGSRVRLFADLYERSGLVLAAEGGTIPKTQHLRAGRAGGENP